MAHRVTWGSFPLNPINQLDPKEVKSISQKINHAACRIYQEMRAVLWQSVDHTQRVLLLASQPRKVGSTAKATPLFTEFTSFEQIIALEHWFYRYKISSEKYSFCLGNHSQRLLGRPIPLTVQKNAKSLNEVMLGNNGNATPAPRYLHAPCMTSHTHSSKCFVKHSDWGILDPWQALEHENFIYHLEALEMVRQPFYIGATLIKGNAYEAEYIDQDVRYATTLCWNYGTILHWQDRKEACVEFKNQTSLNHARQMIKEESAGYNLIQLMEAGLDDIDLCDHLRQVADRFFDSEAEIPEEFSMAVTPRAIFDSVQKTPAESAERGSLYHLMFKLMIAKIGPQTSPSLRAFIKQRLLEGNSCE